MNQIILLFICITTIEIFIFFKLMLHINSIIKAIKKVSHLFIRNNISDHWREKAIPIYALVIMRDSSKIIMILLVILSLFFITDIFLNEFLSFAISIYGVIESTIVVFIYTYFRKNFFNE